MFALNGPPRVILSGAFNPLHAGHRRMAEIASARCGAPVTLELSIANVDKPTLDFLEIDARLAGLADYPVLAHAGGDVCREGSTRPGGHVRRRSRHDRPDRGREILRRRLQKARLRDRRDRRQGLPVPGLWPRRQRPISLAVRPQSALRNCAICATKCAESEFRQDISLDGAAYGNLQCSHNCPAARPAFIFERRPLLSQSRRSAS